MGSSSDSTRLLLIEDGARTGEPGLRDLLAERGFGVTVSNSVRGGLDILRGPGADVVLLMLPIQNHDPVALCAATKAVPYAPILILADGTCQAEGIGAALPAELRPDAVVERPVDPGKLALVIHERLQALDFTDGEDPAFGVSLADLLTDLKQKRANVTLEIRVDGVVTTIYLHDGSPVFAEGGAIQETLGRLLLRHGTISEGQYALVVQRMTEAVINHESLRMGEVLVELGVLTPAQVYDALSLQVREKIIACFQWERFAFEIHESLEDPDELTIFQCPPTESLIYAGVRAHYDAARIEAVLRPHAREAPMLQPPTDDLPRLFQLSGAEQKWLTALDGSATTHALRTAGPLEPLHATHLLAALQLGRALVFQAPAPAPRHPAPMPRGEARPATPPARPAKQPVPRPVHPAAPPRTGAGRPASQPDPLARLRSRIGRVKPVQRSDQESRLGAENTFNQALRMLRENMLPGALKGFRRAAEMMPDQPEYRMFEAWAEFRLAKCDEDRTLAAAKASACAQRTLQLSSTSARAHSILGQLDEAAGNHERAEKHYRIAVRHDPEDLEANRGLRLLRMRSKG
jgi:hypothetical protein